MSRPAPHIIDQRKSSRWITTAILEPEINYIVCRDGKPIMVRVRNELLNHTPYKYRRAVFTQPHHAYSRAAELNELFRTDIYEVYHLVVGEKATHKQNAE